MRHLWNELTRPRGRGRSRRSGVALLFAVSLMLVMTILVTELAYQSRARMLIAQHQADERQAYWLARSGVNIYKLVLMADKQLGDSLGDYLPGFTLWQMLPQINTGLMRMLFGSGGDVDELEESGALDAFLTTGKVDEETAAASREEGTSLWSDKNFLDFTGDFSAEVQDHEGKINVNSFVALDASTDIRSTPTAIKLWGLLSGDENEQWMRDRNLDPWELAGNLADWVDLDTNRSFRGGYEDALYQVLDPPYLTKNAPFDSIDEIRLVEGWQDDVFDRFGDRLTIYGSGKLNLGTADEEMIRALIRSYCGNPRDSVLDRVWAEYIEYTEVYMMSFTKGSEFKDWLVTQGLECQDELTTQITDKSKTFTVTSTGLVGDSSVTITAVLDYTSSGTGKTLFWRVD